MTSEKLNVRECGRIGFGDARTSALVRRDADADVTLNYLTYAG